MADDQSRNSKKQSMGSTQASSSGMSSSSSSSSGGDHNRNHPIYIAPVVAKQEEANILKAKVFVAVVLLLAVVGVSTMAYVLIKDQEQSDFENRFAGHASEIVSVARQKADQLFKAFEAYSIAISSQASQEHATQNSSWPYHFVRDFSVKTQSLAELIGVRVGDGAYIGISNIVEEEERGTWETFVEEVNPIWYEESAANEGIDRETLHTYLNLTVPYIFELDANLQPIPVTHSGLTVPYLHQFPLDRVVGFPMMTSSIDLLSFKGTAEIFAITRATGRPTIGFSQILLDDFSLVPGSQIVQPIYDTPDRTVKDRKIVAIAVLGNFQFLNYFRNILTENERGILVVLTSACPRLDDYKVNATKDLPDVNVLTYKIEGPDAFLLGDSDMHDPKFDALEVKEIFIDLDIDPALVPGFTCAPTLTLHIYPTTEFEDSFHSSKPIIYTMVVALIFVFTSMVFLLYDFLVGRRQRKVMDRIIQQDMVVSNVFPSAIRERLFQNQTQGQLHGGKKKADEDDTIGGFDNTFDSGLPASGSAPLADLFPSVTVVFADIAGFTAWSSAREPQQVFVLLESIYSAFDRIAYRHSVFKVETVGDCYVAAVGLPEPIDNHAVVACKFACDCLKKMYEMTRKMEVLLGPDTADLDMRIGIHSGQVTAGVLRGERCRFQLFGDTMNTAARMESGGERSRIQVSPVTADLLAIAGFSKWVVPRRHKIFVKGKGEMQTYWMKRGPGASKNGLKASETRSDMSTVEETAIDDSDMTEGAGSDLDLDIDIADGMTKMERLVEWNVEVLASLLQQIVASRGDIGCSSHSTQESKLSSSIESISVKKGSTVLEEFTPIIPLKRFDVEELKSRRRPSSIDVGEEVKSQLRNFLSSIAGMYRENAFHNFEHASHVTASVKKLLARIVNTDERNGLGRSSDRPDATLDLVDLAGHSYGITSDPLTQFAVVFSAIIHDVDHPGVPNAQLVKENTRSAQIYKKSIAEQISMELSWDMLMGQEYAELRACIYQTEEELRRFRQLVVNTVMATDIADKELQTLRKNRWDAAFSSTTTSSANESETEGDDRKATIVIEHLIQASDVAHTMQHWHIYKKWNERYFMECYGAYKEGRVDTDPSLSWYQGEIGFFDYYVIPLAKKLQSCGVFGVSSDEYLNYATQNREEWCREGNALVREYISRFNENADRKMSAIDEV
eukprot:scaffold2813_cov114-Cylindrotheca_fusiformis.AAC.3